MKVRTAKFSEVLNFRKFSNDKKKQALNFTLATPGTAITVATDSRQQAVDSRQQVVGSRK
jgi:hypothetical protein